MTAEQQRIAIAEELGFTRYQRPWDGRVFLCKDRPGLTWKTTTKPVDVVNSDIPNYPASLDACAEFEKTLSDREWEKYVALLSQGITRTWWEGARAVCRAKAEQRCLAFLKTKGIIQ